jgi:dihydropteroate synthase
MENNAHVLSITDESIASHYLNTLGVSAEGIELMSAKFVHFCLKLENIDKREANILKQDMLSLGGEVAIPWSAFSLTSEKCSVLLMGSSKQFKKLIKKLSRQPFKLNSIGAQIEQVLKNYQKDTFLFKARNKTIEVNKKTVVMGAVNVTNDSFSGDGIFNQPQKAIDYALNMLAQGADIIDIGGESTRPGAQVISVNEEIRRVTPVIKGLRKKTDTLISIDTYKKEVAQAVLDEGADIINDVTGTNYNPEIISLIKKYNAGLIIMHTPNPPEKMHKPYHYDDIIAEIIAYFRKIIKKALDSGINLESIIIDPGIGFGKTVNQNFFILKKLASFKSLGLPILAGVSRKSFIGKTLNIPENERLYGTCAAVTAAILNGAHIVRVHDITAIKHVAIISDKILSAEEKDE